MVLLGINAKYGKIVPILLRNVQDSDYQRVASGMGCSFEDLGGIGL
jgi:hypothetical protein